MHISAFLSFFRLGVSRDRHAAAVVVGCPPSPFPVPGWRTLRRCSPVLFISCPERVENKGIPRPSVADLGGRTTEQQPVKGQGRTLAPPPREESKQSYGDEGKNVDSAEEWGSEQSKGNDNWN